MIFDSARIGPTGLVNDGGMAEYMVSDAESVVLLPDSLSFEQAAPLMCAGVCRDSHILLKSIYCSRYVLGHSMGRNSGSECQCP